MQRFLRCVTHEIQDFSRCPKDGHVVTDQLRAVNRDRLIKHLGVLSDDTLVEVLRVLQAMFAV